MEERNENVARFCGFELVPNVHALPQEAAPLGIPIFDDTGLERSRIVIRISLSLCKSSSEVATAYEMSYVIFEDVYI